MLQAIQTIPEAIVPFVEALSERAPDIIQALVDNVDEFIIALANASPIIARAISIEVPAALAREMPKAIPIIVQAFVNEFAIAGRKAGSDVSAEIARAGKAFDEGVKQFTAAFTSDKLTAAFKELGAAIADAVKQALRELTGFGKSVGDKANSGFDKFRQAVGIATGGTVLGSGNRDTVPAMLTPGEVVIDRTTGPRLNAFLDQAAQQKGQAKGADDSLTAALLVQVIQLLQQPQVVKTTAELNGNALADILLTLSRTNARTA
jgi:hypothetical protein